MRSRTFKHLELARQELEHLAGAGLEIERLEDVLLLADLELEVARDQIGEVTGLGDAVDERAGFLRQLGHQLDDALRDVLEVHHERVELDVATPSDRGRCGPSRRGTARRRRTSMTSKRETPWRMTLKLSFASLMTFRMRAAQPTM